MTFAFHVVESILEGRSAVQAIEEASRMEVLQQKYPDVSPKIIQAIAMSDPSSLVDRSEDPEATSILRKAGGYTDWLIRQYKKKFAAADIHRPENPDKIQQRYIDDQIRAFNDRFLEEDLPGYADDLKVFHRMKGKLDPAQRDINKLDLQKLRTTSDSLRKDMDQKEQGEAGVIYDGPECKVIVPKDRAAAIKWGSDTSWCTARPENTMFARYDKDGPLFIVIFSDGEKFQLHWPSSQFMDKDDSPVALRGLMRRIPQKARAAISSFISSDPRCKGTAKDIAAQLNPEAVLSKLSGDVPKSFDIRDLWMGLMSNALTVERFNTICQKVQSPFSSSGGLWVTFRNPVAPAQMFAQSMQDAAQLILKGETYQPDTPAHLDFSQVSRKNQELFSQELASQVNRGLVSTKLNEQLFEIWKKTRVQVFNDNLYRCLLDMIADQLVAGKRKGQFEITDSGGLSFFITGGDDLPDFMDKAKLIKIGDIHDFIEAASGRGNFARTVSFPNYLINENPQAKQEFTDLFNKRVTNYLRKLSSPAPTAPLDKLPAPPKQTAPETSQPTAGNTNQVYDQLQAKTAE